MKINGQVFYKLIEADGKPYFSETKMEYGGHNGEKYLELNKAPEIFKQKIIIKHKNSLELIK